jgi:aldose 1-epimerase
MAEQQAETWVLTNRSGLCVRIGAIGAAIMSVETPDRDGHLANIVLGLAHADAYADSPDYVGVVVGRFANRIAGARFVLDGQVHSLNANDGLNSLHGGADGWHKRRWLGAAIGLDGAPAVQLVLNSPNGDGGFPGQVTASVTYTVTDDNRLIAEFRGSSDAATPFSPTQHSYWNLSGAADATIHDHRLRVTADQWLPVDAALLPDGPPQPVDGTALDFRTVRPIGTALANHAPALATAGGYDHCLVLRGTGLREVAQLIHPPSGRTLTIQSDRPALQLYTGQYLSPPFGAFAGLALETQAYPDAPNRPDFPDATLRPGIPFYSRTEFAFGIA